MALGPQFQIATTPVSVGHVLLAATAQGICYVGIGPSEQALRMDLAARFRFGQADGQQTAIDHWLAVVVERIESPSTASQTPPLDQRGTAFQHQVWERLQAIPVGETRSYQTIARELGKPEASRAVAAACAHNPVGVLVPCHRVVRSTGALGGYHWGTRIKHDLLVREGAIPPEANEGY